MTKNVLNPQLYNKLKKRFGRVKVANEGIPMSFTVGPNPVNPTKYRINVLTRGETYCVCCPYCGDTKFHLWINHRWMTRDADLNFHGKPVTFGRWLSKCFRRECDLGNLPSDIKPYVYKHLDLRTPPPENPEDMFKNVELPGICVPLHELDGSHAAVQYSLYRGFDPVELSHTWGVHWCAEHEHVFVRNRLIFPVYWREMLVGWQARRIIDTEDSSNPKYYTMPKLKVNMLLFNMHKARFHKFCVVVEGITDAYRIGPQAVALLGKSMSEIQARLIRALWSQGAVVLMLDGEACQEMRIMGEILGKQSFKHGLVEAALPPGRDPADYTREQIHEFIARVAVNAGVELIYE